MRKRSGSLGPLPSTEQAMAYPYTQAERRLADAHRSIQVVGDSRTVRTIIEELAQHTTADEDMVTANVYDHAERLAEVFGIAMPCKEL